jgi:chemotaxis protein CheX
MMITEICFEELLQNCTQEVFETMIFMDMSDTCDPEREVTFGDNSYLSTITFKGNIEGCLSISCTDICARLITSNMLGIENESEIAEEEINDAFGEVANMIMGSLKAAVQNLPFEISLSIPTVVKGLMLEQFLSDVTGKASLNTWLEDIHPMKIHFEFRIAPELTENNSFVLKQ